MNKIKIAYADDHVVIRKSIIHLMSIYNDIEFVIEAGNGSELIRMIENTNCKPNMCLLDINMPKMNGFETLTEIKRRWPEISVLVFTIFENDLYFTKMVSNGANGYLTKNCDQHTLRKAITSIYHHGYYNADAIAKKLSSSVKEKKYLIDITEAEKVFLKYCCSDLTYKEIALLMKTTTKSIEGHRDCLFKKLSVNSRASLVMFAIQYGIVIIDS